MRSSFLNLKPRKLPEFIRKRRELSYQFNEFDDVNLDRVVYIHNTESELVEQVIEFFVLGSRLVFPAKSYFVAIVYALCMEKYFNVGGMLSADDLLDKDEFYVPYYKAPDIYNHILAELYMRKLDVLSRESTQKTIKYFKQEFLVDGDIPVKL